MRYGIIAESAVERIGLASGQVPTPMLEPYGAGFGRALMVATKIGLFEAMNKAPLTAEEVAVRCDVDSSRGREADEPPGRHALPASWERRSL